ncbi:MAG: hypothetical protein ACRC7R_01715 [Sarcina sp.]
MYGKDDLKLISYDFVDIDNHIFTGKAFKCVFRDELIGEYKMYYGDLKSFLDGIRGTTEDSKLVSMIEKMDNGDLEEHLKREIIKLK